MRGANCVYNPPPPPPEMGSDYSFLASQPCAPVAHKRGDVKSNSGLTNTCTDLM